MKISCNYPVETGWKSRENLGPRENELFLLLVVLFSITELDIMYFLRKIFPAYLHLR